MARLTLLFVALAYALYALPLVAGQAAVNETFQMVADFDDPAFSVRINATVTATLVSGIANTSGSVYMANSVVGVRVFTNVSSGYSRSAQYSKFYLSIPSVETITYFYLSTRRPVARSTHPVYRLVCLPLPRCSELRRPPHQLTCFSPAPPTKGSIWRMGRPTPNNKR